MSLAAHTAAVVSALDAAGVPTGRGVTPDAVGWAGAPGQSAFTAYAIVWRIGGKDVLHRDLDGLWDANRVTIHVRTVGATAAQADALLDTVTATLTGSPLTVAGSTFVHTVYDTSIATSRDTDVEPPLFYTGAYFRFWTQET